jgi:hypothetical protein
VERRLAVHAGPRQVIAVLAAIALAATPAFATPKGKAAKAAFDKGVKAYQKKDYDAAASALQKSFDLEKDADTLFALAQAVKLTGDCVRASELFARLLDFDLPAANREAVKKKIAECDVEIAKSQPKPTPEPPAPDPPAPDPVPPVEPPIEPEPDPPPVTEPIARDDGGGGGRAWYKDPIGLSLVGLGVAGLGAGGALLLSARSADQAKDSAPTYGEYEALQDKAETRGKLGVTAVFAGGALAVAGIVWFVTRGDDKKAEGTQLGGWVDAGGGGLVVSGDL